MDWLTKLVLLVGSISLSVFSLGAIRSRPSFLYTADFYTLISPIVWIALFVVLGSGLLVVLHAAWSRESHWKQGALLIAGGYLVFYFLPHFVGIRLWAAPRADALEHFGHVKAILQTGGLPSVMYPLIHVFISEIIYITGLSTDVLQPLVMYSVQILFALGIGIFCRRLFDSRGILPFALAAATPLALSKYQHHLMPWFFAFSFIPIGLWANEYFRNYSTSGRWKFIVIGLIIVLAITIGHPISAFVFVGAIILSLIAYNIASEIPARRRSGLGVDWALILTFVHLSWYLRTAQFQNALSTAILQAAGIKASAGSASLVSESVSSGYTVSQLLVEFILLDYGATLIVIGCGALATLWIGYRWRTGEIRYEELFLGGLFISGIAFAVLLILTGIGFSNPIRSNQLSVFASILLVAWAASKLPLQKSNLPSMHMVGVVFLVVSLVIAAFAAPWSIYDDRKHVEQTEHSGAEWFIENRDDTILTKAMDMSVKEVYYLYGTDRPPNFANPAFSDVRPAHQLPSQLGYHDSSNIVEIFPNKRGYVITKLRDTTWIEVEPENRRGKLAYISWQNRTRLRLDSTSDHVYSNGGFDVWAVANSSIPQ